jgi:hypothetical protein
MTPEDLDKLKKKTCGCEESELGYHTKDCTFYEYGWNDALDMVKSLSKRGKTVSTQPNKFKYHVKRGNN